MLTGWHRTVERARRPLLTLRVERSLRVSVKRAVRRVFVAKRAEVAGDWRRPHNEKLHDPYCSPDIIQIIKSRSV